MNPTFLIVGATGNTGRSVVETLSEFIPNNGEFSKHRIIALTRSAQTPTARALAQLPAVEVCEQNWVEITSDWLKQRNVVRAFIAPHLEPTQFAEESTFHLNALNAGVKYVVRISTGATNVRPDCRTYYGRQHWAVETLLSSREFEDLHWTSLQPNAFGPTYLFSAVHYISSYQRGSKQEPLRLMASKDEPVGIIDPDDIGRLAAHLLLEKDTKPYNRGKYTISGPEDISGKQIVDMVEERIGTKVEQVHYKDMSFVQQMAEASVHSTNVIMSIQYALETTWEGKCTASTTSQEVLDLAAPKGTPRQMFEALLSAQRS
ncbi:uncharacterized protein HMPREF1541_06194 [Cyphellophora europaea CBS 101466]|uniref:NmrA-like domain-containing protein n=1 Tax=Cyphellophora europaea (strain CBS 101466) TaxID=1220924 RepID=W2RU63_CYPE1|nr:uncharacterized protein HMPREF1541_06194 [Cyphellophora europaea CBS 101466]ETN39967.1 hypothetical protein HMPREF1541_06194 [Cyphellophora europaea CBS 101466]